MRLRRRLVLGHLADLFRLACRWVVSRTGVLAMTVADTVIVGRYSSVELGYLSLGVAVYLPLLLTVMGLLTGTTVAAAHAMGRGEPADCGAAWRRAVPVALGFGAVGVLLGLFGREVLLLTGQSEDVAAGAGRVFFILALGYPAGFLYSPRPSSSKASGSRGRSPGPSSPPIWSISRPTSSLCTGCSACRSSEPKARPGPPPAYAGCWRSFFSPMCSGWPAERGSASGPAPHWAWRHWRVQRMVGFAAAVAIGVEMGAFTAIHLFSGWLGTVPLAVFTIVLIVISVVFMVANGVGIATSVRIGNAYGRGARRRWVAAGWLGLAVTLCLMALAGAVMAAFARPLAAIYTTEAAVLAATVPVMVLAGLMPLCDGGQTLMLNALRGCADAWVPTALQAFAFVGCMVPLALLFAFELERGVAGLIEAVIVSTALSLGLLCARFVMLSRRS